MSFSAASYLSCHCLHHLGDFFLKSLMLNPQLYPSAFENAYRIYLLNATAFNKFSAFLMQRLFKGGVEILALMTKVKQGFVNSTVK